MKRNTRIILSIVGLVFMLTFTVMTIIALYDSSIMGGVLLYLGLAFGVFGISIYFIIMRDNRLSSEREARLAEADKNAKEHLDGSLIDSEKEEKK